jgi:hypothetical protein
LNADGVCPMHAGTTDPRELQRRSARARSRPKAERVNPSLREFLKREVPPAEVWNALKLALEGSSESARVSAARVLIDALHEEQTDRSRELEIHAAAEEFDRKIAARVERHRAIRRQELARLLEPIGLAELADGDELAVIAALARQLAAIPEHVRAEHVHA